MERWTRTLVATGLVAALASAARAEEPAATATETLEVAPGTRVRIRLDDAAARARGGRLLTGRVLESGPDRYVLTSERDGQRLEVPRGAISRVDVSHGRGRRGMAALKGLGIGAAVGALVFGTALATCDDSRETFGCFGPGVALIYGTPLLGAAGAVTGAVVGQERWDAVEAPRRPRVTIAPTLGKGVGARLAVSF